MIDEIPTEKLSSALTVSAIASKQGGKGGDFEISNAEFVAAVFPALSEDAFAAVCSKSGDPKMGAWKCDRADLCADGLSPNTNNYLNC